MISVAVALSRMKPPFFVAVTESRVVFGVRASISSSISRSAARALMISLLPSCLASRMRICIWPSAATVERRLAVLRSRESSIDDAAEGVRCGGRHAYTGRSESDCRAAFEQREQATARTRKLLNADHRAIMTLA